MRLTDYITQNCINPSLLAATKAEALKEMTHLLFEQKKMQGVGPALDQIMARETTESTGIGKGIAVPHARVSGLKQLVCALGRVNGGVEFAAVDRKPVHLVFLICYPPTQHCSTRRMPRAYSRHWKRWARNSSSPRSTTKKT
jgi:mannitol/fructose-specific phosphotransferase system IIA component (Ntr-type)